MIFILKKKMFNDDNIAMMISGVIIALGFIIFCLYSVNKLFVNSTKDVLVRFILLIFTALVGVFIVDKVVAFQIKLLDEQQNNHLFDLIKTLVLMIFSYYFGTQKSTSENQPQESSQNNNKCGNNCNCQKSIDE